jgi:hypothetical protein
MLHYFKEMDNECFSVKGGSMTKENSLKKKADPEKIQVLRMLPLKIKESLTKEEVNAILYEEVWPDSLREKLKDYIVS